MAKNIDHLKELLGVVSDLGSANALLGWDQQTYMPPGGAGARAMQLATLSRLAHDKFISCLLYTSPSPRDRTRSRMPSSA